MDAQNSALPGVRGNGITSRMFAIPLKNRIVRSRPSPTVKQRHRRAGRRKPPEVSELEADGRKGEVEPHADQVRQRLEKQLPRRAKELGFEVIRKAEPVSDSEVSLPSAV